MISKITFKELFHIWSESLWPERQSFIEPTSAMLFLGGYDLENMSYSPTFFAYKINDIVAGVNSGHMCKDNNYRSRGLFVFPKYRNAGIGTELLLSTIEQGLNEGAEFVWSYPRKDSWKTYEAAGFKLSSKWHNSETGINAYCRTNYLRGFL